ncbi:ATP F0F1 synthase subunit B [Bartonella sp. TP]|uniref:F0F1 ATP synthase subunit B family protein n=1 Tax=Bartonella sp. TP TaxID=3057550 RepID=UPI0025B04F45|nr:ATP F0F1 synthase subunit B [Bartonella sp. TP]WJW80216.1 ATP F0F1 synthase subunit B [Bartonella sp. TP]
MTEHSNLIIGTDAFWALVALIIFLIILCFLKVPSIITAKLDKRAQDIAAELNEARRLKEEAQQLLSEYQQQRQDAELKAKEIVAAAKREAKQISSDMRQASQKYLAQRTKLAEEKISLAEEEALKEVKQKAIDISANLSKNFLSNVMTEKKRQELFDAGLEELKQSSQLV